MQSVSSRIWTHVAVSISYDNNHYTTVTSREPLHLGDLLLQIFQSAGINEIQVKLSKVEINISWLIDFNDMQTRLGLFYA